MAAPVYRQIGTSSSVAIKKKVWTLPAVGVSTNADADGVNHGTTKGETVTSGDSPHTSNNKTPVKVTPYINDFKFLQPLQNNKNISNNPLSLFQNYGTMANNYNLHIIDDLFHEAKQYSKSLEYLQLLEFCRKMSHMGPFNATLARIQLPGAELLLSRAEWEKNGCYVKDTANPKVILMPFGPVPFVYDLSDVELKEPPKSGTKADYIAKLKSQFEPKNITIGSDRMNKIMDNLITNLPKEGVSCKLSTMGNAKAGQLSIPKEEQRYVVKNIVGRRRYEVESPALYAIQLNKDHDPYTHLTTITHELGHLYCHHLEAPINVDPRKRWKVRNKTTGLKEDYQEFEAESVSKIVCEHFGIEPKSSEYLAGYLKGNDYLPSEISLGHILLAADKIISMLETKYSAKQGLLYKFDRRFRDTFDNIGHRSPYQI